MTLQSAGLAGRRIAEQFTGQRIGLVENAGWDGLVPEPSPASRRRTSCSKLVPLTLEQLERQSDGTSTEVLSISDEAERFRR